MQLRRLEKVGLVAALAVGALFKPETFSGEAGRMLVIFLGLVSASILPTISLLVNSMSSSGRSVQTINKLEGELQAAMDALFLLFGCVAVSVGALISLSITPPAVFAYVPFLTTDILPRAGQATVAVAGYLVLVRIGLIPGILRRTLAARHEIAVAEAKRRLAENVPSGEAIRASFAKHPDFGKTVSLDELQRR